MEFSIALSDLAKLIATGPGSAVIKEFKRKKGERKKKRILFSFHESSDKHRAAVWPIIIWASFCVSFKLLFI